MLLPSTTNHGYPIPLGLHKLVRFLAVLIVLCSVNGHSAGTGSLDQVSGWYPLGANLTVHATPGTNSVFSSWLGNTNGATAAGPQITFAVNRSLSVTGLFTSIQFPTSSLVKIQRISVSGKTVALNVTNGAPNGGWVLLQSTNLLLPLSQWQTNRTGLYDGNGNLSTNVLNAATNPAGFYILK